MLEYMEEYMLIPGRIENFVVLVDCAHIGVFNAPIALLK